MGLPTLKELIDRHYEKVVSQKETDAERELRLYDEMAAIGACDGMLSAMEVDQYLEPVMDAIDSHYGKFKEHLTPKERARVYRHYVRKIIVKDQEHLNWHRAEY